MNLNLFPNNNPQKPATNIFSTTTTPANPTQPSNTSNQTTPQNLFVPRQTNEAPTTNIQNSSLPTNQRGQNNQSQNLKYRHIDFKLLYKLIQEDPIKAKTYLDRQNFRLALSLSLEYFDKNTNTTQMYERQHSKVQNFGFAVRNLRDQYRNFKCDKIDNIWRTIIELASQITNGNEKILCEYLKNYLAQKSIYQNYLTCTEFSCGSYVRVPNNNFLQSLYRNNYQTNQIVVSIQHNFILQILKHIFYEFYTEQFYMLMIIRYIQNANKKYFNNYIKKKQNQYFAVLWKKFKIYSKIQIHKQIQGTEPRNKKIKQFYINSKRFGMQTIINDLKQNLKLSIGKNLYNTLYEYGSWDKEPIISTRIDYSQAIPFIDQDLQYLVQKGLSSPLDQYNYIQTNLNLLLQIIPLVLLCKPADTPQTKLTNQDTQKLRQKLQQIKSPLLQPFKFLQWFTRNSQNKKQKVQQNWNKVQKNIQWIMRSNWWVEWLGILLSWSENGEYLLSSDALMNQIVKMMKIIIDLYDQQLWDENGQYEFQLIKMFLKRFIQQKQEGIKIFLPVLTKCIEGSITNVKRTLQIISFENLKKYIKDSLIDNLQISDKHNSSIKLSMFMSHNIGASKGSFIQSPQSSNHMYRVLDTYPEQQIKFLCRMVIECRQNLSIVQQALFQCQPQDSTGILVCNFLLQCLGRLRQYKVSALKCMRYIMNALDALFVHQQTRPAFMLALSLTLNSQDGENGKKQLYDMINLACTKPSASQQYRQSQKLRLAISNHICNIVRFSRYIHQYFPTREDFKNQNQFLQVKNLIYNQNYSALYYWYCQFANQISYRVTPWLSSLLLVLQNDSLLPIDFQTIRLLILKLQVDKNWKQQFDCMANIIQILNKSNIVRIMLDILKPRISTLTDIQNDQQLFMFKLQNNIFFQFRQLNRNKGQIRIPQNIYDDDQSIFKKREKQKNKTIREMQNILGNIAGTLQLISTLLYFKNSIQNMPQNMTQLFSILNLYNQFTNYLTQKSKIYHYKIPISTKKLVERQSQKKYISLSSFEQPQISINIIQVIASYLNVQKRYILKRDTILYTNKLYNHFFLHHDEEILNYLKDQYFSKAIKNYQYNNLLYLDQNQLTFDSDFTIGIGNTLRLLCRLIMTENGSSLIYNCLTNRDYSYLYENGESGINQSPQQFTFFLKQLIRMLEDHENLQPKQIQIIFQFLTLGISQSYFFALQLLQTNMFTRLRKIIKQIFDNCENQYDLGPFNKILLFVLALSDYRENHTQQIQSFMRLPQSLIQEALIKFATVFQRYHKISDDDNKSRHSVLSNFDLHNKMGLITLYKGSVHICFQLLKRYFLIQSLQQNIKFIQIIIKISQNIMWMPPKPSLNTISNLQIKNLSTNKLKVNPNQQICLIQTQITNNYKYHFKSLTPFIGFITSINQQYGRNYQIYVIEAFDKIMLLQHMRNTEVNNNILKIYRINYEIGLQNCHQLLFSAFLGFIINVQSTGDFGHLLSFTVQDSMLAQNRNRERMQSRNWLKNKNTILQIKNIYKYQAKQQLGGSYFWGHDFQQSYKLKKSLIRSLIDYFERNHNWQHSNDILMYTITLMLNNLSQYWQISPSFINDYKKQLTFILHSIKIHFKISPKIFSLLYHTLISCFTCCKQLFQNSSQDIKQIINSLSQMILYGGNIVSLQNKISNSIYNEKSIQQNLYIICYTFSQILSKCPEHAKYLYEQQNKYYSTNYKYNVQSIISVTDSIIDKYLVNYQNLDINNMAIINLINQIFTVCAEFQNHQHFSMHKQTNNRIVKIINKFIKFIGKALQLHGDNLFNAFLLQSLAGLHEQCQYYDVQCFNSVMEIVNLYIDSRIIKGVQIKNKYNQYENNRKQNIPATSKKNKINSQYNQNNYYFTQLICPNKSITNNMSLINIIQIKQLLLLLVSICNKQLYWQNQKYSYIVQSIFSDLVNQQFIYKFLQGTQQSNGRILQCRVSTQNASQQHLQQIIVNQLQNNYSQYQYRRTQNIYSTNQNRIIQQRQLKSINLFQFIVHLQMLHSIRFYIQCLLLGLKNSQSLKSYYSKMLNNGTNNIDEFIWSKISTTLFNIIEYVNDVWINLIRFYPISLNNLLTMYRFCKNNTDIGYDIDFLNLCFGDAGLSNYIDSNPYEEFRQFILDIALAASNCGVQFIQIWKANDWKASINWVESRNKLTYQISSFLKKCEDHLKSQQNKDKPSNMIKQLHSLRTWFESTKSK